MKNRFAIRIGKVLVDLGVLSLAFWLAFFLRFDGLPPVQMLKRLVFTWPYVVGFQYFLLVSLGVTRCSWRFVGIREARQILGALGTATAVLVSIRLVAGAIRPNFGYALYALIPLGVIIVDAALAFLAVAGARIVRRAVAEHSDSESLPAPAIEPIPTVLIGAGQAGSLVAREIARRPDLGILPIGFLDDDPLKAGTVMHGLSVLGSTEELPQLTKRLGIRQALITIASTAGSDIRRIVNCCEEASVPAKIIPGIYEILDGKVNLSRIRQVSIEDVLRREPIKLDQELVGSFLAGKRVLVTGAGGSIGSELCRQVARFRPAKLILVERAEYNLFTIHQELRAHFPELCIIPRICDICDSKRVDMVFAEDRPQVVFHAAAHKHVPMMEWNPGEAIKNNVFGTQKVADAADRYRTEAFVLISTDKAVNPTSIMGATKRVAEIYTQSLSRRSKTKYVAVRFGNVLGSTGSVIPIFKAQIAAGGPVTITHPKMKRYFMTIPEASQLVMQAAAMGEGGEIFVLDMGEPVRILDLARDLIRLSGFEPDQEIKIEVAGVRPGEKLFEELGFDAEKMNKTRHSKIFVGRLHPESWERVQGVLSVLSQYTSDTNVEQVRSVFHMLLPEMQVPASAEEPSNSSISPSLEAPRSSRVDLPPLSNTRIQVAQT